MVQLLYIIPGKAQYGPREKEPLTEKFSHFYWIRTSILSDGYGDLLSLMSHQHCLGRNHTPHGLTKNKDSEINLLCVREVIYSAPFHKED